ncbi:hypothetical protein H2200_004769 [Cladophialophora chaetospira]|uniref:Uncharacterized protein n=1 Tax=Cladophialophora chaetospira TaxID=386627 RepID=A0AA39CKH0_9EURO|nr:hypothetical protein H2200_004769 [Cladophialophora chaetospira]
MDPVPRTLKRLGRASMEAGSSGESDTTMRSQFPNHHHSHSAPFLPLDGTETTWNDQDGNETTGIGIRAKAKIPIPRWSPGNEAFASGTTADITVTQASNYETSTLRSSRLYFRPRDGRHHQRHENTYFSDLAPMKTSTLPTELEQTAPPSARVQRFLKEVPLGDLAACAKFLSANPATLEAGNINKELLSTAEYALTQRNEPEARSCVEKALIVRQCQGRSTKDVTDFFRRMHFRDYTTVAAFDKSFGRLFSEIQKPTASQPEPLRKVDSGFFGADQFATASALQGGRATEASASHRKAGQQKDTNASLADKPQAQRTRREREVTFAQSDEALPVRSRGTRLNPESPVRVQRHDFFTVGRVFAIMWPEPTGDSRESRSSQAFYGPGESNGMRTSLRRLIVVREKDSYCLAVPIVKYDRTDSQNPSTDLSARAIAYVSGTDPQLAPSESKLTKTPICIQPGEGAIHQIASTSRIHFGKLYTVEHALKVMEVGRVSKESMPDFDRYWREELM